MDYGALLAARDLMKTSAIAESGCRPPDPNFTEIFGSLRLQRTG